MERPQSRSEEDIDSYQKKIVIAGSSLLLTGLASIVSGIIMHEVTTSRSDFEKNPRISRELPKEQNETPVDELLMLSGLVLSGTGAATLGLPAVQTRF